MSCADVGNSKVGGRDEARATYEIYIWTPERHGSLHRNNHRMEAVRTMEPTGDDSHERFVQPSLERDMPTNQKTNHSMSTSGSDQVLQLPQLLANNRKKKPTSKSQCVSLTAKLAQRQASCMTPAGLLRIYMYMYSCPHMILTTE